MTVKGKKFHFVNTSSELDAWEFDTRGGRLTHLDTGMSISIQDGKMMLDRRGEGNEFVFNEDTSSISCKGCIKQEPEKLPKAGAAPPKVKKPDGAVPTSMNYTLAVSKAGEAIAHGQPLPDSDPLVQLQQWSILPHSHTAENKWADLFNEFGTHFIDEMHLGGRMMHTVIISKDEKKKIESSGLDVSVAVEGSFGPVSGGAAVDTKSTKAAENGLAKAKTETHTTVLGGTPPDDLRNGFDEWAESVAENPMPVKCVCASCFY